jgi:hypothetical protein
MRVRIDESGNGRPAPAIEDRLVARRGLAVKPDEFRVGPREDDQPVLGEKRGVPDPAQDALGGAGAGRGALRRRQLGEMPDGQPLQAVSPSRFFGR